MPPTFADRVGHILDATDKIKRAVAAHSRETFVQDVLMRLAVERLLEIISEASRSIPDDVKANGPAINWRGLADLGNWLRHAYHQTDADLLWDMIKNDLPSLEIFLRTIVGEPKA